MVTERLNQTLRPLRVLGGAVLGGVFGLAIGSIADGGHLANHLITGQFSSINLDGPSVIPAIIGSLSPFIGATVTAKAEGYRIG